MKYQISYQWYQVESTESIFPPPPALASDVSILITMPVADGLEKVGIEKDYRGHVPVNLRFQSVIPNIAGIL